MYGRIWAFVCAVAWGLGSVGPAPAQDYPTKGIDLIVPFAAGGTTDVIARLIAQRMTDTWGKPAIVVNRPGAASTIGTNVVARAAPDGHTLLVTTIAFSINGSVMRTPYDALRDFAPITELASIPIMLVVHPSLPVHSIEELIAYSKANGGLDCASAGTGTATEMAADMFGTMTGAKLVNVPFKGNSEIMNALVGGHVKVHFALVPAAIELVKNGSLRALAVTTEKRLASLPELPTISELGFPGYSISSWQGMFAPAKTPIGVVSKINELTTKLLALDDVKERIRRGGADPVGSPPDVFSGRVRSEFAKWAKVVGSTNIQPSATK